MGKAVHTPFSEGNATRVGPKRFRKQILPVGKVEHPDGDLDFTRESLTELAENFTKGAVDQVPFVLVNDSNEHSDDPEKFRGDLTAVEVADDGLYGIFDLTDEGAALIEKNPKLAVSARIKQGVDKAGSVLAHVAGTLDARAKGMGTWAAIDFSDDSTEVRDLTEGSFSGTVSKDAPTLTPEVVKQLQALASRLPEIKDDDRNPKPGDGELTEEEANKILDGLLKDKTPEPVAALSEDDSKRIELAESKATDAEKVARKAQTDLADERWERERQSYIDAGVPPSQVDLAEPLLKRDSATIELSDSSTIDAAAVARNLLDEAKGTINFSEMGVNDASTDERTEAKQMAEKWAGKNGSED